MVDDPIVEQVRAIRDDIAKRYNYDIEAIVVALQKRSLGSGRQTVNLPPKPVSKDDQRKVG